MHNLKDIIQSNEDVIFNIQSKKSIFFLKQKFLKRGIVFTIFVKSLYFYWSSQKFLKRGANFS